jgi:putative ABC transport system ATP-binding protein
MREDAVGEMIRLEGAARTFRQGDVEVHALRPAEIAIARGELVAVVGRSGSGKSTFLNLVTGIDRPTAGSIVVDGVDTTALGESALAAMRGRTIGIVFQFFELIPTLTVLENVVLAMDLVGAIPAARRRERGLALLDQLGVADQAAKLPSRLSGGQLQRVAVARALANDPPILVADEPSGNLDTANGEVVFAIFRDLADSGRTIIVATHERARLDRYDRVLEIVDGRFLDSAGREAA